MKALIGILVLLATVSVYADDSTLVRYEYAKEMERGHSPSTVKKYTVSVDETGTAHLKVERLDTFRGSSAVLDSKSKDISRTKGFKDLQKKLKTLYTADVQTVRRMRVCALFPKASQKFRKLEVRSGKSDSLRVVLSNEGCWMISVTRPTDDTAAENARKTKEQLEKIGNSFKL